MSHPAPNNKAAPARRKSITQAMMMAGTLLVIPSARLTDHLKLTLLQLRGTGPSIHPQQSWGAASRALHTSSKATSQPGLLWLPQLTDAPFSQEQP